MMSIHLRTCEKHRKGKSCELTEGHVEHEGTRHQDSYGNEWEDDEALNGVLAKAHTVVHDYLNTNGVSHPSFSATRIVNLLAAAELLATPAPDTAAVEALADAYRRGAISALESAAVDVAPALQNEVGGHTSTRSVRQWLLARAAALGSES